jgi:hypothetical protein
MQQNQFVIAPTYTIATNYIRSKNRNPREWKIIAYEDLSSIARVRGVRGGIAEDIVSAEPGSTNGYQRLLEIRKYLEMFDVEIKPVHY